MNLNNDQELEFTRSQIAMLEGRLRGLEDRPSTNPVVRDLTRRSLIKLINQMKEEIVRYKSHQSAPAR